MLLFDNTMYGCPELRYSNVFLYLVGVTVLALLLRFVWVGMIGVHPESDSVAYQTFAQNIVNFGVYGWEPSQPGAYWPVGTSAILAAGYSVFGFDSGVVVALNLVTTVGIMILTWYLGFVYFGVLTARISALLIACWPLLIQFTSIISSELFFMFFTLLSVASWEKSKRSNNRFVWLFVTGVSFASASYVRPVALLLPFALAIAEMVRGEAKLGAIFIRIPMVIVTMAALIAPWSYRNYTIFGEVVPISTNFGANFWMGNSPGTTGEYQPLPERVSGLSETERSHILLGEAKAYISENPGAFLRRTISKAFKLHDRETIGAHWNRTGIEQALGSTGFRAAKIIPTFYWYCVLGLALCGIVLFAREIGLRRAIFSPPVIIWGYFTLIHAIIVIQDRYHSPSIPFIALLASYTLAVIAECLNKTSARIY